MIGLSKVPASSSGKVATLTAAAVMHLGEIAQITASESSPFGRQILALVARAREAAGDGSERAELAPLTFAEYKDAIRKIDSIQRAIYHNSFLANDSPELRRFGQEYDREKHTPDFAAYVNYLGALNDDLGQVVLEMMRANPPLLLERDLGMHAAVVGGSGSGKSELLKLMVHHYVIHPKLGAVIVLDPHGKVSREIARWRELYKNRERLVYLDAKAFDDAVPSLNPLNGGTADDETKAAIASQLADAIGVLRANDSLSGNMADVAKYCLRVLLDVPGASLGDLAELLSADKDHPLVAKALASPDDYHRKWFEVKGGRFFDESMRGTRVALLKRLDEALFAPLLRRVLTGPNPFNLEAAIEAHKIICVNCASVGPQGAELLGRLLVAQVAALGQRRISDPTLPRTPVRVFVDEATKLMSPAIFVVLKELRKVGVSLVMGQQDFGDGAERDLVRSLRTNTSVKLFGARSPLGEVRKMLAWEGELPPLRAGQFLAAWGDQEPVLLNTFASPHLADDNNAMADRQWRQVLEMQRARYYQPLQATGQPSPALPSTPTLDPMDEYPA